MTRTPKYIWTELGKDIEYETRQILLMYGVGPKAIDGTGNTPLGLKEYTRRQHAKPHDRAEIGGAKWSGLLIGDVIIVGASLMTVSRGNKKTNGLEQRDVPTP